MKFLTNALVASLLLSTGAQAQVSLAPAQAMTVAPVADNVLRTGTEVQLKLSEPLSTKGKKLRVGQHFQLSVMEAVSVGGNVVIPVGSPAVGEITEVRNKGMWGKSGHLTASLLHVSVNGRQIRLNGTFDDKGPGKSACGLNQQPILEIDLPVVGDDLGANGAVVGEGPVAVPSPPRSAPSLRQDCPGCRRR